MTTVCIPDEFKDALEQRFNVENAEEGEDGLWQVSVECPLCVEYEDQCRRCLFTEWKDCTGFIEAVLGDDCAFCASYVDVYWLPGDTDRVAEQFKKLLDSVVWVD